MDFHIFAGICSALAIIFLLVKFNIKKVLFFDIAIDLASVNYHCSFIWKLCWNDGGCHRWCAHISYALDIEDGTIGYGKANLEKVLVHMGGR